MVAPFGGGTPRLRGRIWLPLPASPPNGIRLPRGHIVGYKEKELRQLFMGAPSGTHILVATLGMKAQIVRSTRLPRSGKQLPRRRTARRWRRRRRRRFRAATSGYPPIMGKHGQSQGAQRRYGMVLPHHRTARYWQRLLITVESGHLTTEVGLGKILMRQRGRGAVLPHRRMASNWRRVRGGEASGHPPTGV